MTAQHRPRGQLLFQAWRQATSIELTCAWLLAACVELAALQVHAAGIVPDGGTATSVSVGVAGRQVVTIAPPVANGVSHNTYSSFSVGKPGADLINSTAHARVIVNEVTSTNPSLIEGEIAVVGPRANVILANPNGITVNGASFVNTGALALTTGRVSLRDFQPSPGFTQRNVVLDTSVGRIEIGPDGLCGAFSSLELIAKQIKVTGKIENTFTNANAHLRLVAGDSHAEFDTSVSPADNLTPFVQYSSPASSNPGVIAVDITPLGSLVAGRIELVITDRGAGVRHAGTAYATVGDFVVSAAGQLQIDSGRLQAAQDIVIQTSSTRGIASGSGNQWAAGRNIEIQSGDIRLQGGTLQAGSGSQAGNITIGIAAQNASAETRLAGNDAGAGYMPLSISASGGIGLYAQGQALVIDGAALSAQQNLVASAASIALTTQVDRSGGPRPVQASLASQQGEVRLTASGAISTSGGVAEGAAGFDVTAASLDLQSATVAGQTLKSRFTSAGGSLTVSTPGTATLHAADLAADQDVSITAGTLALAIDAAGQGSKILATAGAVTIATTGDLANTASLIQGKTRSAADATSRGAVTLRVGGDFLNASTDASRLGAVFGSEDDVVILAQGDITNRAGRILSNRGLTLQAQGDVLNYVPKSPGANGEQRADFRSSHTSLLLFQRGKSGFDVDYGRASIQGQGAYLVADGDANISARNITNDGGEIYSNAASIQFSAQAQFVNRTLTSGAAHFERSCFITCRSHASSDVSITGGLISAAQDIRIDAGTQASNIGGRVLALADLRITSPKVLAQGITGYSVITRDSGMKSWFGDTWAQIYAADVGGSLSASRGRLIINGTLYEDGAEASAGAGVEASGGTVVMRPVHRDPVVIANHLGLSSWLGY